MIKIRDFLYIDEIVPNGKKFWRYEGWNTDTNKTLTIFVDTQTKPDKDFDKIIRERIIFKLGGQK